MEQIDHLMNEILPREGKKKIFGRSCFSLSAQFPFFTSPPCLFLLTLFPSLSSCSPFSVAQTRMEPRCAGPYGLSSCTDPAISHPPLTPTPADLQTPSGSELKVDRERERERQASKRTDGLPSLLGCGPLSAAVEGFTDFR